MFLPLITTHSKLDGITTAEKNGFCTEKVAVLANFSPMSDNGQKGHKNCQELSDTAC